MEKTMFIPSWNVATLKEKIAKLCKRAVKLGCEPVTVKETGKTDKHEIKERGKAIRVIPLVEVEVSGPAPKLAGWSLVGVLEFNKNYSAPIIREVPGKIVPKKYRNATPRCEHCKSERRRNEVFIVENGKKMMQVGRSCLADFLGHDSPEHFLAYAAMLPNLDALCEEAADPDRCFGGREPEPCFDLEWVLAIAHAIIEKLGFVSRKMVEDNGGCGCTTSGEVAEQLYYRHKLSKSQIVKPTADNDKAAKRVIKWMKKVDDSKSNYLHTLKQVAKAGVVDRSTLGVTCSAYTAYLRDQELLETKKRVKGVMAHVGTVGKRELFEVRFISVVWFDTFYGMKALVKLADRNGNNLIWGTHAIANQFDHVAAGGYLDGKTQVNVWYTVKATVKEHSEFRGIPQTELQRLVVMETKEERVKPALKKAA